MGVTISPVEANDFEALTRLNEAAFPLMYPILYDGPLKDSTVHAIAEQRRKAFTKRQEAKREQSQREAGEPNNNKQPEPQVLEFKAVDDSTGQIIGEARWWIWPDDEIVTKSIEDEIKDRVNPPVPQMQVPAFSEFMRLMGVTRREVLALPLPPSPSDDATTTTTADAAPVVVAKLQKRVYLGTLTVHPDHQRRGIGRKLLQTGLGEADKLGLIAYLEASMEGVGLYKKEGFETIKTYRMDLVPFGGVGEHVVSVMIRQPRTRS